MNSEQYNLVTQRLTELRDSIVTAKRPEYTEANPDVLHNFKTVAKELGITPMQVWYVYFRKHITSISRYCTNPDASLAEPIEGRIADAMNYLELLNALRNENV